MSEPIRFEEDVVRAICRILGDTSAGLTGREIGELLRSCRIDDPMPSASKRDRLFEALSQRQRADGAGNAVAMFILRAMSPARYVGAKAGFDVRRAELNEALAFAGLQLRADGKFVRVEPASSLSEAGPTQRPSEAREGADRRPEKGTSAPTPVNIVFVEQMFNSQIQQATEASIQAPAVDSQADQRGQQSESIGTRAVQEVCAEPGSVSQLTKEQEADYCRQNYWCLDRLHVSGTVGSKRRNLVVVNREDVWIGDSLLIPLLRFVIELKRGEGGWVSRHTLKAEGIIADAENYQLYLRLRKALQGYLLGRDALAFIQNEGAKSYRISTHPDFVTCDRDRLLGHPNRRVQELARRLPEEV